ncbi:MAG: T9SS type A sorting domain-containing protein, partial [Flavobacteriales bacterium]|nr:T9SS type A sorting domain-containing protein [Flavobacteriales bacterium]
VYVVDTTAPVLEAAADMTIECDMEVPAPDYTVSDNCDENPVVEVSAVVVDGECPAEYVMTRTYTATDACGNVSTDTQVITVVDTTAPVLAAADDVTIECDQPVPAPDYTVSDNCSEVEVVVTAQTEQGDCPAEYVMTRTYTATDACGNVSVDYQVITVQDTTAPWLEVCDDVIMECDEEVPAPCYETGDNCSEVTVEVTEEVLQGSCPAEYVLTRTYTATDACGNTTSDEQMITVVDTTAPILVAGPDMTIECDEEVPGADYTVEDNCSTVEVVYNDVITEGDCPQEYTITRTYSATDACGNTASDVQIIAVVDTTAPVLAGVPQDETVNCNDDQVLAVVTASDNCDELVEVEHSEEMVDLACGWQIIHTWCASDDCGNQTCAQQVITVIDTDAPVFTYVPADATYECDQEIIYEDATATDNCSDFIIEYSEEVEQGECPQQYDIIRCWTATDDCDNSSTMCQTIHVQDTTAPVFDPYEIAIDRPCDDYMGIYVTATDNCGEVTITFEDTMVSGGCMGSIIRDYTATDECGNASYAQQIIMLTDEIAPTADYVPADATIECDLPLPQETASFSDNCDDELEVMCSENITNLDCGYMVNHICTATDACGNETTVNWTITVVDITAPIIELSSYGADYECDQEVQLPEIMVSDNCDEMPVVTMVMETIPGDCPQSWTDVYTWTATDNCGNASSASFEAVYDDTTAPEFTYVPDMQYVSCDGIAEDVMAEATDNCGMVTITSSMTTEEGDCPQSYAVITTWTATDECGNASTAQSVVNYYDDQAPVWDSMIDDISVECADEVPVITPTASDNCGEVVVVCTTNYLSEDDCGNYSAIVTCTATDECGNQATMSYSISVYDQTAPVLFDVPDNLVLDCQDEVPAAPEVTATDNCDDVEVMYTEEFFGDLPDPEADQDCHIVNPESDFYTYDWGMLFQPQEGDIDMYYHFTLGDFLSYPDGSAHITGQVVSYTNPNAGFDVDIWLENGMDWDNWSTQDFPTSYKDDWNLAGDNYLDWWYYVMSSDASLAGFGDYAGSSITMSHAPSNYYYGFQVGIAANNVNANYGGGGWFFYEGSLVVDGGEPIEVNGAGDFAFDLECCPDYWIERTWCAEDCSGNMTCASQLITFEDLDGINYVPGDVVSMMLAEDVDFDFTFVGPNPSDDVVVIKFMSNTRNYLTLTLTDAYGNQIKTLFSGNVTNGIPYDIVLDAESLHSGIYIATLSSMSGMKTQKIVVNR